MCFWGHHAEKGVTALCVTPRCFGPSIFSVFKLIMAIDLFHHYSYFCSCSGLPLGAASLLSLVRGLRRAYRFFNYSRILRIESILETCKNKRPLIPLRKLANCKKNRLFWKEIMENIAKKVILCSREFSKRTSPSYKIFSITSSI